MKNKAAKTFLIGFIPSLILPAVFIVVFIHYRYHGELGSLDVIREMFRLNTLSGLIAMSAFPNLLLFLYAMHTENWLLGRGVISATMLYGIAAISLKTL